MARFNLNRVVSLNQVLTASLATLALAAVMTTGACGKSRPVISSNQPLPDASVISFEQQQAGGFRTQWQWAVGLNINEKIDNIWQVGDALYVFTNQDQLHSVSADKGTKNWTLDLGPNRTNIYAPTEIANGSTLMIVSRSNIFYVDKNVGAITRRGMLAEPALHQPIIAGDNMVYGSAGFFYGTYADAPELKDWSVRAENDLFIAPILKVDESNVVTTSYGGYVWSLRAGNGVANWNVRKVNGHVVAQPAISADKKELIILADDKKAYAFDNNNGNELWNARLNGELTQKPVFVGQTILVVGDNFGLFALDAATGLQKWFTKNIQHILRTSDTEIIAADKAGSLVRLNIENGDIIATSKIVRADQFVAASGSDTTVFVATKDGRIAAVDTAK